MTVSGLIEKADALFPNVYRFPVKAGWLYDFDKRLVSGFLSKYREEYEIPEDGLSPDRELLLDEMYTGVYINYLCMLMELYSGNITGYTNRAALFNSEYLGFMNDYNRTHLIKSVNIRTD